MPYIDITTNAAISRTEEENIKNAVARAMEESFPGKTENWLMVRVTGGSCMYFGGSGDKCAMFDVSIFGRQNASAYDRMTSLLCGISEKHLGVNPSRTYVKYSEVENWGWNGSDF